MASTRAIRTGTLLLGLVDLSGFTLQAGFSAGSEAELRFHGHGFYSSPLFRLHSPFNYFGIDVNSVAPRRLRPASRPRRRWARPRALNPAPSTAPTATVLTGFEHIFAHVAPDYLEHDMPNSSDYVSPSSPTDSSGYA